MTLISLRSCQSRELRGRLSVLALLLLAFLFGAALPLDAQRRLAPRPIPYSELEREEGEQRLQEMRHMGIEGVYSFLFELRVMPRRGDERRFRGQLWGSRNPEGPLFRYDIRTEGGDGRSLRFLVQNGFDPEIWYFDSSEAPPSVRQLETAELFTPIPGTDFTPFDLQMPYLFWEDFAYEGLSRVRGRSSHGFLMYPPAEVAEEFSWLGGVRMYLDAEFNALTGAEVVAGDLEVLRSFNIIDIKRVGDEWIVKSIDYRDRRTGDKTRLSIYGASFGLPEDGYPFSPEALEEPFPSLSREEISFF